MKTGFWDRVLVYLYVIITLVLTVSAALRAFGFDLIGAMIEGLRANAPGLIWRLIMIGICALVCVLGVYVFVVVTPSKRKKGNFINISTENGGQVRISLPAVRQLANQAIAGIDGLQDVAINVGEDDDAVVVNVAMDVESGVHVPSVTMNIQSAIKRNIERNCGVSVKSVTVTVKNVLPGEAAAVSFEETARDVEIKPVDNDIAVIVEPEEFPAEEVEEAICVEEPEQYAAEEEAEEEEEIVLTLDKPVSEEETQEEA